MFYRGIGYSVIIFVFCLQDAICEGLDYNFRITLNTFFNNFYSDNVTCRSNCEAIFPIIPNITQYMAEVWAINRLGDAVGTHSNILFSRLR